MRSDVRARRRRHPERSHGRGTSVRGESRPVSRGLTTPGVPTSVPDAGRKHRMRCPVRQSLVAGHAILAGGQPVDVMNLEAVPITVFTEPGPPASGSPRRRRWRGSATPRSLVMTTPATRGPRSSRMPKGSSSGLGWRHGRRTVRWPVGRGRRRVLDRGCPSTRTAVDGVFARNSLSVAQRTVSHSPASVHVTAARPEPKR